MVRSDEVGSYLEGRVVCEGFAVEWDVTGAEREVKGDSKVSNLSRQEDDTVMS